MNIPVLDHGYIRLVEAWGKGDAAVDEAGIIEAARQSTQGSFRGWEKDEALLKYLYKNRHDSPFEFAGMVVEVQAPIFIFREWHRHRTQSYNEMSARYTPLPDLNYLPTVDRLLVGVGDNKQAQSAGVTITPSPAAAFIEELDQFYVDAEKLYQRGLSFGVPKEIARFCLPAGRYSRMRASANLRNWLAFLTLRMAPNAQWEIQQYANALDKLVAACFPRVHELFTERHLQNTI